VGGDYGLWSVVHHPIKNCRLSPAVIRRHRPSRSSSGVELHDIAEHRGHHELAKHAAILLQADALRWAGNAKSTLEFKKVYHDIISNIGLN
jgi:hypothetical protein